MSFWFQSMLLFFWIILSTIFWDIHSIYLQFLTYRFPEDLFSIMPINSVNTILVNMKDAWIYSKEFP